MKLGKIFCGLFFTSVVFAGSPVGNWISIDEKTGVKRAIISISAADDVLSGVLTTIYPEPGETGICSVCPGAFKNKKIEGLRILWDLKKEGQDEWAGGSILDPKSGKIYRLKAKLEGNKLHVRGYIGLSFIGRTQIWVRAQENAKK